MLSFLGIRNLAVVEKADLEFPAGFNAVTGETGAGKSVLLGALGLLAGARADREAIRAGATEMSVEGGVEIRGERAKAVDAWLSAHELPTCEDGQLVIRRTVFREKAGRALVNGAAATQALLQELGALWLDIHGPGEAQTLFSERRQLELLDSYAKNAALLSTYVDKHRRWRELLRKAEELRTSRRLGPDEIEFLKGQLEKIERAKLTEESVAALDRDFTRLEGARELIAGAGSLAGRISGQRGIAAMLAEALVDARRLSRLDPELNELATRLDSAAIELSDIAQDFAHAAREASFDERTAKALRERMELWMEIRRKYGPDVASVLRKAADIRERIGEQSDIEGRIAELLKAADALLREILAAGEALTQSREKAAHELGEKSGKLLSRLGFRSARLRFEVFPEPEPREHGTSSCRIVFAPNPGMPPRPLAKIASSGELARVMLAIKTVLAEADETPVLVFDEVDANVGGEAAVEVARQLAGLGKTHQVFVVTHLPQVAALASAHFLVEKRQEADSTHVSIKTIHTEPERRVAELARMLGDRNSPEAILHAQALLRGN
ncbi:MAG TPA: DNA repair protein RecN [Opitutales bacterium]|nr:DNA repair protein RecN [Opitutales bacterium]